MSTATLPITFLNPGEDCRYCQERGHETFRYMRRHYLFDVDAARRIVADGRQPVEVDEESVRYGAENVRLHKRHIPHVNTAHPGIIAHVLYKTEEGEIVKGHILIDGNHRAARCLQLEIPFLAYILTEDESQEIMLRGRLKPKTGRGKSKKDRGKAKNGSAKSSDGIANSKMDRGKSKKKCAKSKGRRVKSKK